MNPTHDWSEIVSAHSPERQAAARREAEARKVWMLRDEVIDYRDRSAITGVAESETIKEEIDLYAEIARNIEQNGGWLCLECLCIQPDDAPLCLTCAAKDDAELHDIGQGA